VIAGRCRAALEVAGLALLAYVPALTAAPGRIPADTKLYLYLDPARQMGDALWSFDTRQFAGWVPHQIIGYLWPSGPFYWLLERVGVPDWIAHRLWLGTILLLAGAGLRWSARRLGLAPTAALAAAVVYQLSPYVLPYLSRTSVLLLPWAALGWLVGLTIGAATRTRWRDAAFFALIVATVGGINATALLMIAPVPVLWLIDAAARDVISWRRAGRTVVTLGALSLGVSLWWMTALAVQARYGAAALSFSETLEAVSSTAVSSEVLRGLGYWLFYVGDPVTAATTAARAYQESPLLLATGFALVVVGMAGLVVVRWSQRRFAALCLGPGMLLAVGAYPIDDPSPVGAALAGSSRSTLVLALRSSTRAVPMVVFALALGAGAVVTALGRDRARTGLLAAVAVMVLAVLNLPPAWTGRFVDPDLDRPQDLPSWWTEAGRDLDAMPDGYRVLQVPGMEFSTYRWGHTVDPVLPGVSNRPLVTRDLLPLGSPAAMDTLYALDDRFQAGVAERAAVGPVARLLGADTVLVTPEIAFERYQTPRPEPTWALLGNGGQAADGLGAPVPYGAEAPNLAPLDPPAAAMVDEEALALEADGTLGDDVPPLALIPVEDPEPVVRAGVGTVVVSGSGDGVVDAAAAGLVDGHETVRYAAATEDLTAAVEDADLLVATDTNRLRARQWRGSQDVWGFTEDGEHPGLLDEDPADHRLEVFPDQRDANVTTARQSGPVRATASAYGEPNAYRPEVRAAQAVDGDPATAWVVADRADPLGQRLRIDADEPVDAITVLQARVPHATRWITEIRLTTSAGEDRLIALTEASRDGEGQPIDLEQPADWWELEITGTNIGPAAGAYPNQGPVGFAEVTTALGPSREVVEVPADLLAEADADSPLAIVLTRLRADPLDRWRADPERALVRSFTLGAPQEVAPDTTGRLDRRATDTVVADLFGVETASSSEHLVGDLAAGGWAAVDGDPDTAWLTPFGVGPGPTLTIPTEGRLGELSLRVATGDHLATVTEVELARGDARETVAVDEAAESVRIDPGALADEAGPLTVTVTGTDGATATDRRYGEITLLPSGIAEIAGPGLAADALPERLDTGCRDDLLTVDGEPLALRVRGTTGAALAGDALDVTRCGPGAEDRLALDAGAHEIASTPGATTGFEVDRVVLTNAGAEAAVAAPAPPTIEVTVEGGRAHQTVTVGACPEGCWLDQGVGWNPGWTATVDGRSLGEPELVSGGMNGWYLPPSDEATTVDLRWRPQRWTWAGLALSLAAVVACIVLVLVDRRRDPVAAGSLGDDDKPALAWPWARDDRRHHVVWAVATVAATLVVAPIWGLAVLAVSLPLVLARRSRLVAAVGLVGLALVTAAVVVRQVRLDSLAGFGWVSTVAAAHRPTLAMVVLVVAAALPSAPRATTGVSGSAAEPGRGPE
jgi:arabinofuranan 3-O-arabinosyltransferase